VPSPDDLTAARREMMASQEKIAKLSKISPEMLAAVSADLSGID
jgi:predicted transcriptional regulator